MNVLPIFACGPNQGFAILVECVYGGVGAGGLSLSSGVAGFICMAVGKQKAGRCFFSIAGILALLIGGMFLWMIAQ